MNIHNIVDALKAELAKLNQAIDLLNGVGSQPARVVGHLNRPDVNT